MTLSQETVTLHGLQACAKNDEAPGTVRMVLSTSRSLACLTHARRALLSRRDDHGWVFPSSYSHMMVCGGCLTQGLAIHRSSRSEICFCRRKHLAHTCHLCHTARLSGMHACTMSVHIPQSGRPPSVQTSAACKASSKCACLDKNFRPSQRRYFSGSSVA